MGSEDYETSSAVRAVIEEWKNKEGPLLPILNDLQRRLGYIPREFLPLIAEELNLSRAEVYGVFSFYHDYRSTPPGRHVLKVCRAEACQAMGGDALAEKLQRLLGVAYGETSANQAVTLEPVYCLGLCACAPSAMLDGEVIGRLDEKKIEAIAQEVRR